MIERQGDSTARLSATDLPNRCRDRARSVRAGCPPRWRHPACPSASRTHPARHWRNGRRCAGLPLRPAHASGSRNPARREFQRARIVAQSGNVVDDMRTGLERGFHHAHPPGIAADRRASRREIFDHRDDTFQLIPFPHRGREPGRVLSSPTSMIAAPASSMAAAWALIPSIIQKNWPPSEKRRASCVEECLRLAADRGGSSARRTATVHVPP